MLALFEEYLRRARLSKYLLYQATAIVYEIEVVELRCPTDRLWVQATGLVAIMFSQHPILP